MAAIHAATNFMLATESQEFSAQLFDVFVEMLVIEDQSFFVKQELAAALTKVLRVAVPLTSFEALFQPGFVPVVRAVAGISGLVLIELFEELIHGAEESGTVELFAQLFDACDGGSLLEAIEDAEVQDRARVWMEAYMSLLGLGE